ncbi:MAG: hypothetical protein ABI760_25890, partial [Ferruginibacter sp.]
MKENLHDIDKLFRAALENQAEPPSSTVWDAIDKKLDKTRVVEINMKYARLKKIAITLLVLLMGAGVYTWKTTREFAKYDNKTSIKQDNSTNSLTNSQNRQDNLIISNILNTDETLKTEINKKDPGKQERNANGLLNTTDGTENTALKNLPGS